MDLTSEEERYKQKILSKVKGLIGAHLALTVPQHKSLMDKVEAEALAQLVQAGRSPFALERDRVDAGNREIRREREIELNGYHLSASAFSQFVPTLRAVAFMPDPAGSTLGGKPTVNAMYSASSQDHREASVGRDELTGICDTEAVGGFVRERPVDPERSRRCRAAALGAAKRSFKSARDQPKADSRKSRLTVAKQLVDHHGFRGLAR